ncbi:MAG: hypothetical protein QM538_03430 [Methylacidiphilales bacterium]|nr:hypothetical protein [Candidatus Methylacidiphilales bacterium]
MLSKIFSSIPTVCLICDFEECLDSTICQRCLTYLEIRDFGCVGCGATTNLTYCDVCLQNNSITLAISIFKYRAVAKLLVNKLKFTKQHGIAKTMAELMIYHITRSCPTPDIITSVPLHPIDFILRGHNQSALLASAISDFFPKQKNIYQPNILQKIRRTKKQRLLNREQRLVNLQCAFTCKPLPPNSTIAIVDDVITTGSTTQTLGRILKLQGAKDVYVWSFAHG